MEALLVLLVLFLFVLTPARVVGSSMAPTLKNGEVLLVDKLSIFLYMPPRGALVVFDHPLKNEELIKRIIALPGETVEITDGKVYIDGCLLDESAYMPTDAQNFEAMVVPHGEVFMLGDDRAHSLDSRDEAIGCIPIRNIRGRVRLRVSPVTQASIFL